MQKIEKLPEATPMIGSREIAKAIKNGKIKKIVFADNCPEFLINKFNAENVEMFSFKGDQKELGTRIGKPFPVAVVGYES